MLIIDRKDVLDRHWSFIADFRGEKIVNRVDTKSLENALTGEAPTSQGSAPLLNRRPHLDSLELVPIVSALVPLDPALAQDFWCHLSVP